MTTTTARARFWKAGLGSAPENYEQFFVPVIGRPLAERLIAEADLRPGERVLDVACGTGIVARLAAHRVGPNGDVAALDVNAGMLAVARSLTAAADRPIRWYETTAEAIPLPDDSFDVAFCQLGLMFVADKDAALREMHRVVAPGGRVLVSVPAPTKFFEVLDNTLERHLPAGAEFLRVVFSLNDATEIERRLRGAGFSEVTVRRDELELHLPPPQEFLWQYIQSTPLAGLVAQRDRGSLADLEDGVITGWQPWVRDGGMACRHEAIVATARK